MLSSTSTHLLEEGGEARERRCFGVRELERPERLDMEIDSLQARPRERHGNKKQLKV